MRRHVIIGGLLLIGLGVILGATVFRTDIAQATGLAQAVTVSNTPAQAVPVREQNTDSSAGGAIAVHEQGTVKVSVSNNSSDNVPYQHTIDFNPDATICGSNLLVCRVEFPAVPPGKRLILGPEIWQSCRQKQLTISCSGVFARASLALPWWHGRGF